jgi:hypothetical protein
VTYMAFANSSVSDLIATGIESRTGEIADNVTKNNALLSQLKQKGRIKTVSGGTQIFQELSFQQNSNGGFYSGYDLLPVSQTDVISAATYSFRQYAVPVVVSGLELLQNAGRERIIDLVEGRLEVAEATAANDISQGLYSDGTGSGGKQVTGLLATIPSSLTANQTDTYGGISRTTWSFWRASVTSLSATLTAATASTTQNVMNLQWASQVRGADRPDLVIMDNNFWKYYMGSLQAIQRFTEPGTAKLGFPTIKYMDADVVLDGGIGGFAGDGSASHGTAYFLNTKYLHWRPHKERNFVPLSPNKRYSINQDAEVQILAWAGNLTCSGAQFQGKVLATTV